MGVSIDLHIYDYFNLVADIKRQVEESGVEVPEGRSVNDFVETVMPHFGIRTGDKFVTLWNEYYEDYNSGNELMRAMDLYFGTKDTFLGGYDYGKHANAYEVLSGLGIEPVGGEDESYE